MNDPNPSSNINIFAKSCTLTKSSKISCRRSCDYYDFLVLMDGLPVSEV